ncbi:MAG: alpha/beta hydrolase [Acidobacteriota bacterium]
MKINRIPYLVGLALSLSLLFCFPSRVLAQPAPRAESILLWPGGAPGAVGDTDLDKPDLTLYPAHGPNVTRTAVVICPGGGYAHLAIGHEGHDVARWFNSIGVSAFVLKYRLGMRYHYPAQLQDVQRALRYVRAHSSDWGVDPQRIGVMGFSAGGHLASTAGTHFDSGDSNSSDAIDRQSSRPDFMILIYPVITLTDEYTHQGSKHYLLGENPDPALVELLSNEKQVTKDTPPTFLIHADDDTTVPPQNSILFYLALKKAGVRAEMHIFRHGGHGFGLAPRDAVLGAWPGLLRNWLLDSGLLR